MFFSKFTSPEQSYAAELRQDTQHQQPQATHSYREQLRTAVQKHLSQKEIHKMGLSVQAPSSSNYGMLNVDTVVRQIMTDLSEAVSEKGKK
jgi:hypothetical protein